MKSTVTRNEDIIWRRIEDKVVLIGKEGATIHTLNRTASHIWDLCDGVNSPNEIAANLCERFDVPAEEAIADVRETINKLEQMGLIEKRDDTIVSRKDIAS
jgi:hypothetical protein